MLDFASRKGYVHRVNLLEELKDTRAKTMTLILTPAALSLSHLRLTGTVRPDGNPDGDDDVHRRRDRVWP